MNNYEFKNGIGGPVLIFNNGQVSEGFYDIPKQVVNLIKELEEENKRLKDVIETYDILLKSNVEVNKQLKEKMQKAIDYINNTSIYNNEDGKVWLCECVGVDGILEILESE